MGSKNLSSLIPTFAPEEAKKERKAPAKTKRENTPVKKSAKPQYTPTTFRIENDNLTAVKAVAFWERKKIQDVLNEALDSYLNSIPAATLKKAKTEYQKRQK